MDPEIQNGLQQRAIEWHIRLRDGNDETWEAFADWLAQDPRHRTAYEVVEQTDLAIEPLLPELVFPEVALEVGKPTRVSVFPFHWRWLAGGALAASVAVAITFLAQQPSSRYEVITQPGQHQTIALDANTRVTLNGSTRMTFDRNNPRFAALVSGEALFQVHHDDTHPFTLEVGNDRIQDVGTVFNVVRDPGELRLAVAAGKVIYSTRSRTVPLGAGQALMAPTDSGTVRVTSIPTASVGAWQNGRLVYSGEPLSQVAADLGRSLGIHIVVAPVLENRPFSGAIVLEGVASGQLERLKMALNVDLEPGPSGWSMKPLDNGRR